MLPKSLVLPLLCVASSPAFAGGFGGPPPFTNGSPLNSGTDGIYQAVATGVNLTGLFAFTISGGIQTSSSTNNKWVFFVDGQILTGTTQANISNDRVAGVLDSVAGVTDFSSLPVIINVPGNAAAGFFSGEIDLNSPIAAFHGEGALEGTPARTDQLIIVSESGFASTIVIEVPGSDFPSSPFKFRGTRLSTVPVAASATTTGTTTGTGP